MRKLIVAFIFGSTMLWAQSQPQRNTYGPYVQGNTAQVPNAAGSQAVSFEYVFSVTPASVSITIQGCMRGAGQPGSVGTCDSATDTYTGTTNSIRSPSFTKVYDTFLITVGTLSAGTSLTVNTTLVTSKVGTSSGGSGSGTVSANNGSAGAVANYAAAGGSTTVGPDATLLDNGTAWVSTEPFRGPNGTQATPTYSFSSSGSAQASGLFWSNGSGTCLTFNNTAASCAITTGWQFAGQLLNGSSLLTVDSSNPSACTEGTGCAIVTGVGSLGFEITVGTTPGTTGTITFAHAAVHGWRVNCDDLTTTTEYARTTAFTSTTVTTVTFFANGGTATAPTAADTVACNANPA